MTQICAICHSLRLHKDSTKVTRFPPIRENRAKLHDSNENTFMGHIGSFRFIDYSLYENSVKFYNESTGT